MVRWHGRLSRQATQADVSPVTPLQSLFVKVANLFRVQAAVGGRGDVLIIVDDFDDLIMLVVCNLDWGEVLYLLVILQILSCEEFLTAP